MPIPRINLAGRQIIEREESCRLTAYLCPAGIPTIGYGHTGDVTAADVKTKRTITQHEADTILEYDLEHFEQAVAGLAKGANTNQFSALVSLTFNIGIAALSGSTLLKRLQCGAPLAAAEEFGKWCHAGKNADGTPRVLPGLVRRRAAERALFLTEVS